MHFYGTLVISTTVMDNNSVFARQHMSLQCLLSLSVRKASIPSICNNTFSSNGNYVFQVTLNRSDPYLVWVSETWPRDLNIRCIWVSHWQHLSLYSSHPDSQQWQHTVQDIHLVMFLCALQFEIHPLSMDPFSSPAWGSVGHKELAMTKAYFPTSMLLPLSWNGNM